MSKSRNIPYYFSQPEGTSSWEPPAGTDTEKLKNYMAEHHSTSAVGMNEGGHGEKIRASHLLVKHKDSRRPSSWKEVCFNGCRDILEVVLKENLGRNHTHKG
jgi:NIMA-interacting peptidyl-prolyl cis-trans isomerase 1